ncbi:hypothetical protein PG994_006746 [Apiospora phragmitis]|uniref:Uncharacterized protein n=1 Tax=Apiospora phragmitis TaxID=2905665 RepID=A0ABR1VIT9_9PEZI
MERQNLPRLPGQLHTPTQSFSESGTGAGGAATPDLAGAARVAAFNDKKFKEEYEYTKSKLSDQKFDIRDYPDPLLPRNPQQETFLPKGVTTEIEQHLIELVQDIKQRMAT